MGLLIRLLIRAAPLLFFMILARAAREMFRPPRGGGRTYSSPPPGGPGPWRNPGALERKSPFEVLGCSPSASDEEIKKRYRELLAKYHPDKFIGQNLDAEFVELASRKFQEIQEAYEAVRSRRGF